MSTNKPLIDQIREVLEENQVMTIHALKNALPHGEDETYDKIRGHLLTLLEHDEIFIHHKISENILAVYVWKGDD